jgi:hypothetical protein
MTPVRLILLIKIVNLLKKEKEKEKEKRKKKKEKRKGKGRMLHNFT